MRRDRELMAMAMGPETALDLTPDEWDRVVELQTRDLEAAEVPSPEIERFRKTMAAMARAVRDVPSTEASRRGQPDGPGPETA